MITTFTRVGPKEIQISQQITDNHTVLIYLTEKEILDLVQFAAKDSFPTRQGSTILCPCDQCAQIRIQQDSE